MLPNLKDGDVVLINERAYVNDRPQIGHIVVALHPFIRDYLMIKRVQSLTEKGAYFLRSDNSQEGTDSSSFGAVRYDRIKGRVTCRL